MPDSLEQKSVLLWLQNTVSAENSQTWCGRWGEDGCMGRRGQTESLQCYTSEWAPASSEIALCFFTVKTF